ncbi:MAG TPA: hypothetical protein VMV61_13935 [Patescibacteria group bacterium]|nr:hypothetical protein [Patescibacteria group bacterium]
MSSPDTQPAADRQIRVELLPIEAEIALPTLSPGVDNLRYDVSLSPRFLEGGRRYLADLIRHTGHLGRFYGTDTKAVRAPETSAFRKLLGDMLQAGLNQAHFEKNVELDILLRLGVIRFLTREIAGQFAAVVQECNDWIKRRGEYFERSEGAQVKKATLAEFQADRKNIYRQVGLLLFNMLCELEEGTLSKARRALFGDNYASVYDLLSNRLLFVEGGRDDLVLLENYVLLGNFARDPDRFEVFEDVFRDFLRDFVVVGSHGDAVREAWRQFDEMAGKGIDSQAEIAGLIAERDAIDRKLHGEQGIFERLLGSQDPQALRQRRAQVESRLEKIQREMESVGTDLEEAKQRAEALAESYHARLGEFLDHPENARRLFDPEWGGSEQAAGAPAREWLLDQWTARIEQRELIVHILAAYELRGIHSQFCPPLHLQQLKKAIVLREEQRRVEDILKHFPSRQFPLGKLEEASRRIHRFSREELRAAALRFAGDYMRLRHDLRCAARVNTLLEKISLVENDRTRELSHLNNSLYEFLMPDETRHSEERVISHVVIKADVRNSTQITHDLLERGLNPASHFSLNLYEPMKKLLDRYGAARVFIEGDAIILAIYETQTTRMSQRAVAKACSLAREMIAISEAYNARPDNASMPRLELGIGIAFQDSAPTMWMDGDFRIMISRALNLSDRLSSCSKIARRLVEKNQSPFRVFLLQTLIEGTAEEEAQELLIRYNVGGILLNEDGFAKLTQEISLTRVEALFPFPWGEEEVQLFYGEVPVGSGLEKLVVRRGQVRYLRPEGGFGGPSQMSYYEVCANVRVIELAEALVRSASAATVGAPQLTPGP